MSRSDLLTSLIGSGIIDFLFLPFFVVPSAQVHGRGARIVSSALLAILVRLLSRYTSTFRFMSSSAGFVFEEASVHHSNRLCRSSPRDGESAGHKGLILLFFSSFVRVANVLHAAISSVPSAASSLKCSDASSPSSQKPIAIKDDTSGSPQPPLTNP